MGNATRTLCLTVPAEPVSVAHARRALRDFAIEVGADQRQIDAVRLAGSEAVTNAVVHAYLEEPGNVYVSAALVCAELCIVVADDGCGLGPRTERPGLGLGLGVISQVSDELTITPRAGGGTEVRMRFRLTDASHWRRRASPSFKSRTRAWRTRRACNRQWLA
jgi:anti-sigma regulatory factor (Ser/Thr protein kinase)